MLFVDYNQKPAITPLPPPTGSAATGGPLSTPISWNEVDDVVPRQFTIATVPDRYARHGDLHAGIDDQAYRSRADRVGRPGRPRIAQPGGSYAPGWCTAAWSASAIASWPSTVG